VHDDKNVEDVDKAHFVGADSCDSARYGILAFRHESTIEPAETRRQRLVAEARQANPTLTTADLVWMNTVLEEQERANTGGAFTIARSATRRGRIEASTLGQRRGLLGPGPGWVDETFDFSTTPYGKIEPKVESRKQ
jgi:hypothetical protein